MTGVRVRIGSNIRKHSPYLQSYDQIMENGTREYSEPRCHKCGWKVDQEDDVETSNQYMGATANIRYYHKFCYNGMTTHDKYEQDLLDEKQLSYKRQEESMND